MEQMKTCSRCKNILILNSDNFRRDKSRKDGFEYLCKKCRIEKPKKVLKDSKANTLQNYKKCSKCHVILEITSNNFYKDPTRKDGFSHLCKICAKEKAKSICYHEKYSKRYAEYRKNYYSIHKEKYKQLQRYRYANKPGEKERMAEYQKNYLNKFPGIKSVYRHTRKSKEKNAISNFTIHDWNDCIKYFNNECAYCGNVLHNKTQDHVIPVSKGGHYIKKNIVPACRTCNNSKRANDMITWYRGQPFFSQERLDKIHQWIHMDSNI